ncbi:zinc finger protein ZIC 5 [Lates japonicus]|uniref:Zinc finger protein ZIC 5 n=1 Tax=Lates japonicus TaxID=270547 RepID=A0AAD3R1V3_LATJO|nr:zinc finger protein ZIC 5 [Lates japonicus]
MAALTVSLLLLLPLREPSCEFDRCDRKIRQQQRPEEAPHVHNTSDKPYYIARSADALNPRTSLLRKHMKVHCKSSPPLSTNAHISSTNPSRPFAQLEPHWNCSANFPQVTNPTSGMCAKERRPNHLHTPPAMCQQELFLLIHGWMEADEGNSEFFVRFYAYTRMSDVW